MFPDLEHMVSHYLQWELWKIEKRNDSFCGFQKLMDKDSRIRDGVRKKEIKINCVLGWYYFWKRSWLFKIRIQEVHRSDRASRRLPTWISLALSMLIWILLWLQMCMDVSLCCDVLCRQRLPVKIGQLKLQYFGINYEQEIARSVFLSGLSAANS